MCQEFSSVSWAINCGANSTDRGGDRAQETFRHRIRWKLQKIWNPISYCFRSSNCISGTGKTPCAGSQRRRQHRKLPPRRPRRGKEARQPILNWFFWSSRTVSLRGHISSGAETEKKEAAEPKHVPARLVTWPAVLTALEGLCLSLLFAFAHMWPAV